MKQTSAANYCIPPCTSKMLLVLHLNRFMTSLKGALNHHSISPSTLEVSTKTSIPNFGSPRHMFGIETVWHLFSAKTADIHRPRGGGVFWGVQVTSQVTPSLKTNVTGWHCHHFFHGRCIFKWCFSRCHIRFPGCTDDFSKPFGKLTWRLLEYSHLQ